MNTSLSLSEADARAKVFELVRRVKSSLRSAQLEKKPLRDMKVCSPLADSRHI